MARETAIHNSGWRMGRIFSRTVQDLDRYTPGDF